LAEATRKYAALQSELKTAVEVQQGSGKNKGKASAKPLLPTRKLRELKLAFSEFYLSLILLQNYQTLNHTGFRKILKKHDKVSYCINDVIVFVIFGLLVTACVISEATIIPISLASCLFSRSCKILVQETTAMTQYLYSLCIQVKTSNCLLDSLYHFIIQ